MNSLPKLRMDVCTLAAIGAAILLGTPARGLADKLDDLGARARAAAPLAQSTDPKIARKGNTSLAKVHAELSAYASQHRLTLTRVEHTHKIGKDAQGCPGTTEEDGKKCTLSFAILGKDGVLHCIYDCVAIPKAAAPSRTEGAQENSTKPPVKRAPAGPAPDTDRQY
jgi:hypothetical protein